MLTVKALRVFRGLMAFLTAIPLKMDEDFLELSARFMFLFPVIGALIGFFDWNVDHEFTASADKLVLVSFW